jgi:hypothetical protein
MHDLIQRTVGPAIQIEVVCVSDAWIALVDISQLENALLNLCINVRDAMPDGGRITIESANKWIDERAARQQNMSEGQYLALSVSDTGTGMSADVIAPAFWVSPNLVFQAIGIIQAAARTVWEYCVPLGAIADRRALGSRRRVS